MQDRAPARRASALKERHWERHWERHGSGIARADRDAIGSGEAVRSAGTRPLDGQWHRLADAPLASSRAGSMRKEGPAGLAARLQPSCAPGQLGAQAVPSCWRQMEKLVPQPHEAVALGLWTLKEEPMRSSTKSISEPARYCSETGSTSTRAPARSITRSSGSEAGTRSNL